MGKKPRYILFSRGLWLLVTLGVIKLQKQKFWRCYLILVLETTSFHEIPVPTMFLEEFIAYALSNDMWPVLEFLMECICFGSYRSDNLIFYFYLPIPVIGTASYSPRLSWDYLYVCWFYRDKLMQIQSQKVEEAEMEYEAVRPFDFI